MIQYDNTGYNLYLPMKKYRVGKWYDGDIIYYSEEMARFKIQKWKNEFQVTGIGFSKQTSLANGKVNFSMSATVKDPSDCEWQVCLGSQSNPKYETDSDGYIEYA